MSNLSEATGVNRRKGNRSHSSSSFLCSGHLLIIIWQCLSEITRNTMHDTWQSCSPFSHTWLRLFSILLFCKCQCTFQKDKTQTSLRMKTSKNWREACTRIPMPVNSTWVSAQTLSMLLFTDIFRPNANFEGKPTEASGTFPHDMLGLDLAQRIFKVTMGSCSQPDPAMLGAGIQQDPLSSGTVRRCTADSSLLQPTLSKKTTHPLTDQNTQVFAQQNHCLSTPLHTPCSLLC